MFLGPQGSVTGALEPSRAKSGSPHPHARGTGADLAVLTLFPAQRLENKFFSTASSPHGQLFGGSLDQLSRPFGMGASLRGEGPKIPTN